MITIAFEFPAGRYHATPWGRHVNEGAIEWPPSPWRVLRALIATGFAKLGWSGLPSEAHSLLLKLASELPTYGIPRQVGSGHTRHYMPDYKGESATPPSKDRVLDAWVHVGRGAPKLVAQWGIELAPSERVLLEDLIGRLAYLGRAESWVQASLAEWPESLVACPPGESAPDSRRSERISLLAPMPEPMFADWRSTMEVIQAQAATEASRNEKRNRRVALPETPIDALLCATSDLHKAGWSQPPGSRWVTYWRLEDAVVARPEIAHTKRVSVLRKRPDTALLAVSADTRNAERYPRIEDALYRCEALHDRLVRMSTGRERLGPPAPSLAGKDESNRPLTGHRHAFVLPVDLSWGRLPRQARMPDRGWIDHFLVYAPMGFEANAQDALRQVRRTFAKNLPELFLTLVALGQKEDFAELVPLLGRARTWRSLTPFVSPRHLKPRGNNTLEGQVLAEVHSRGLPDPASIEIEVDDSNGRTWASAKSFSAIWGRRRGWKMEAQTEAAELRLSARWRHFRRERRDTSKPPPQSVAVGLRITFEQELAGPLALGYASHFGMGTMIPAGE